MGGNGGRRDSDTGRPSVRLLRYCPATVSLDVSHEALRRWTAQDRASEERTNARRKCARARAFGPELELGLGLESGFFLTNGGGGSRLLVNPQTHRCPTPTGGGGLLDTPPPPTHPTSIGKMPYHRPSALTSAFSADPKSPTMAYPPEGGEGGRLETHSPRNSDTPPPPVG